MGAKILCVDDSEIVCSELRRALEGAGYEVVTAADGAIGIQAVKDHPDIELIICDVNMPNLDGIGMCKRLFNEKMTDAPIIMLTTESSSELKAKGKALGVKGWISKPFQADKLLMAIGTIVPTT